MANFSLELCNEDTEPREVVVCTMLDLIAPEINVVRFEINSEDGVWKCNEAGVSAGVPPNYHFGCEFVFVPAAGLTPENLFHRGSVAVLENETATFLETIEPGELAEIYFDILRAQPLDDASCAPLIGANRFLAPMVPQGGVPDEWVNIWAFTDDYDVIVPSASAATSLTPVLQAVNTWSSGNWVTMDNPDEYPARFEGTLSGGAAGTVLELSFGDGTNATFKVPSDPDGKECEGTDVSISLPFVIGRSPGERTIASVVLDPDCIPEEGSTASLRAEVRAVEGTPLYDPGQLMHQVDVHFIMDTQPPELLQVEAHGETAFSLDVVATDANSRPTEVAVFFRVDSGDTRVTRLLPRPGTFTAGLSTTLSFTGELPGVLPGDDLRLSVLAGDGFGNVSTTPEFSLEPGPSPVGPPDLAGDQVFAELCAFGSCDAVLVDGSIDGEVEFAAETEDRSSGVLFVDAVSAQADSSLALDLEFGVADLVFGDFTSAADLVVRLPEGIGQVRVENGRFDLSGVLVGLEGSFGYEAQGSPCAALLGERALCSTSFEVAESGVMADVHGTVRRVDDETRVGLVVSLDASFAEGQVLAFWTGSFDVPAVDGLVFREPGGEFTLVLRQDLEQHRGFVVRSSDPQTGPIDTGFVEASFWKLVQTKQTTKLDFRGEADGVEIKATVDPFLRKATVIVRKNEAVSVHHVERFEP